MRVIVTGAAGMIGANLVHGLNAIGIDDVIAVDDLNRWPEVPQPARRTHLRLLRPQRLLHALRARRVRQGRCGAARRRLLRHDGAQRALHARHQLPLLEGTCSMRARPRACGCSMRRRPRPTAAAHRFEKSPSSNGRSTSTATRSCCSTTSCGACCRPPRRRSWAFGTSTSMVRANSTRAAWRRSRSTTTTSFATPARCDCSANTAATGRARRSAISCSSTMWSRSTSGSSNTPEVNGIFNLGTGRAQPFNDVALATVNTARALQGEPALPLADLVSRGFVEYIPFPDALVGKYQCHTEADLTRLRATGCEHRFADVAGGVAAYVRWPGAAIEIPVAPSRGQLSGCPRGGDGQACARS